MVGLVAVMIFGILVVIVPLLLTRVAENGCQVQEIQEIEPNKSKPIGELINVPIP